MDAQKIKELTVDKSEDYYNCDKNKPRAISCPEVSYQLTKKRRRQARLRAQAKGCSYGKFSSSSSILSSKACKNYCTLQINL